jgi:formylglycine-generating enzyme required for sulfatase activity
VAIIGISASPKYGGLRITPQLGLVPIGPDPESGLWEFAHIQTGEPAQRGANGKLALKPETGLVFVLLPGGRVPVEMVNAIETPNQDSSLTKIDLDPFFVSKYEMTNGQWDRIGGWKSARGNSPDPLFPVVNVSWDDCSTALRSALGWMCLPSEAQWEYSCRAGTTTPWWTGDEEDGLHGAANIRLDGAAEVAMARIGTLRPNAFGLHDVHGNAWEWCRDTWVAHGQARRKGDGLEQDPRVGDRVFRGGAAPWSVAADARSAHRIFGKQSNRNGDVGLRPVRTLTP